MASTPGRALLLVGATVPLLLAGAGCSRWMDYTPMRLQGQLRNQDLVFQRLVQRSRTMGYSVEQVDPGQRHFRVRAHLDQTRRKSHRKVSYFHIAVRPGGAVDVTAQGYHVRHGSRIHNKLCEELNVYLDTLTLELGPPAPPPGTPAPPLAPLPPGAMGQR